jgi:hypothetical protein
VKLYVLFAQRKQRYNGQYGIEVLAATDEFSSEDNPDWIRDTKAENEATGDFESLAVVTLEVSEAEIRKRLTPEEKVIPAKVVNEPSEVNPDA